MDTENVSFQCDQLKLIADLVGAPFPLAAYLAGDTDFLMLCITDYLTAAIQAENDERMDLIAEVATWREKYIQCRRERNQVSRLLKLGLMYGVITSAETSDILKMTDLYSGSDVSDAAKFLPES